MESHRTATYTDYKLIAQLLNDGNQEVLVRSLLRSNVAPYPLLNICQGPFVVTEEGVNGLTLNGVPHVLRIKGTDLCIVELRRCDYDGEWFAPEMGGIILLIPIDHRQQQRKGQTVTPETE